MSLEIPDLPSSLEWKQNSLKFATTDFRRNWRRWIFWAAVGTVGEVVLIALDWPNANHLHDPSDLFLFLVVCFVGAFAFQLLAALGARNVKVSEGKIELGRGRASRWYNWHEIAVVQFMGDIETTSMLLCFKSGREVEVFLDASRVSVSELKGFFYFVGVKVSD